MDTSDLASNTGDVGYYCSYAVPAYMDIVQLPEQEEIWKEFR